MCGDVWLLVVTCCVLRVVCCSLVVVCCCVLCAGWRQSVAVVLFVVNCVGLFVVVRCVLVVV